MQTGNTPIRKVAKWLLAPFKNSSLYRDIQAMSMARDIRTGRFSDAEQCLLPFAIRAGENAVDLGANYGSYVYQLSKAVGPGGKVYAFEPVPFTFQVLRKVCGKLRVNNAALYDKGVGETPGKLQFTVPLQPSGQLMAGQAHIGSRNDDHAGKEKQVRWKDTITLEADVVTLDDVLRDVRNVSFVKSDIEGAEVFAFRGARNLIERDTPTILTEINPWFLEGFGLRVPDLTEPFRNLGYRIFQWNSDTNKLHEVADSEIVEANYCFIHPKYIDRLEPMIATATGTVTA